MLVCGGGSKSVGTHWAFVEKRICRFFSCVKHHFLQNMLLTEDSFTSIISGIDFRGVRAPCRNKIWTSCSSYGESAFVSAWLEPVAAFSGLFFCCDHSIEPNATDTDPNAAALPQSPLMAVLWTKDTSCHHRATESEIKHMHRIETVCVPYIRDWLESWSLI